MQPFNGQNTVTFLTIWELISLLMREKQRQQMGERRDTVMAAAPPWTAREADCGDW